MDVVLPEPLGPSRPKIFAGGDVQVKVVERDKIVVALDEVFDADDVCHEAALLLIAARYDCIIAGAAGAPVSFVTSAGLGRVAQPAPP